MSNSMMTVFGFLFIFVMTSLGGAVVIFFRKGISARVNSVFLALASGIMVAASIWSLIIPALDKMKAWGRWSFVPTAIGIVVGMIFLLILGHITRGSDTMDIERGKCTRLFVAVTAHNIPEGLAVGFAFGTALADGSAGAYIVALGLAIGIGVQNFPEGIAVALPVKGVTGSRLKGFLLAVASGVVEPIFALLGYYLAGYIVALEPWLLSFSAGAMLYVVVSDLMPSATEDGNTTLPSVAYIVGFLIMMALDVALG